MMLSDRDLQNLKNGEFKSRKFSKNFTLDLGMILHLLKILTDRAQNIFEWFLLAGQLELATCKNPTKTILLYCQVTKRYILVHSPCTTKNLHMKLFQLRSFLQMEHRHLRIFLLHLLGKIFHRDWLVASPKDNLNPSMILYCKHERPHVEDNLFKLGCYDFLISRDGVFDPFLNIYSKIFDPFEKLECFKFLQTSLSVSIIVSMSSPDSFPVTSFSKARIALLTPGATCS